MTESSNAQRGDRARCLELLFAALDGHLSAIEAGELVRLLAAMKDPGEIAREAILTQNALELYRKACDRAAPSADFVEKVMAAIRQAK